jgi:aryl-phospho-beta-D-glucosidase BglC (GH1 family)
MIMKKISISSVAVTLILLLAHVQCFAQLPKASAIASQMYPGWNLGNTMEPPGKNLSAETSWQPTKTSQQVIDYISSLGFKSVRIPCSWNCHAVDGVIDAAWLARVKEVVDYCLADGLYVLLNDHWDNGWIEVQGFTDLSEANVSAKQENLKSLWTQVAEYFKDYDEHLLFAGLNEPNCDNQAKTDVLIRYEQAFIDAVRATGGNNLSRTLVVQGPSTDIDNTDKYYDVTKLTDSADGCLMVEVHYYSPWNFAGMEKDESWGKMSWYWGSANHVGGSAYNSTWGEESYLLAQFKKMKAKFVDKGYPVILGEYGCQWRDLSGKTGEDQAKHDASVKAFHRQVNEQAVNLGLVPMVWDINSTNRQGTKGTMTIIDRKQLGIFNQHAIDGITEGVAAATWGGTATSLQRVPFRQAPESAYSLSGYRVGSDYQGVVVSGGRKYIRPLFY